MNETNSGQFETAQEAVESSGNSVSAWMQAISLQEDAEKEWRKEAKKVSQLYVNEGDEKSKFNILYSNTQTIAPAIYNSQPIPDIRERYEESEEGKYLSRVLERSIKFELDSYDFHPTMQDVVLDTCLVGRGIGRVRYSPEIVNGFVSYQSTTCELVDWDSIVIGPAKRWSNVPWVAFKHFMTRGQLNALSPEVGPKVKLDEVVRGADDEKVSRAPSIFKRALVYEIWDKESGTVIFIAPTYTDAPLKESAPPFNISGFYPIPRPVYAAKRTDSLKPTIPYKLYEEQAKELDNLTKRICSLTKCLKWRGVYAKGFEAFGEIEKAEDGEFIPTQQDFAIMSGMGLDKAVLFMPINDLVNVIRELVAQREQVKQTIYEITGISDILRGSTKATETLGAQQLKAQWGSLRISELQEDVQRFARDLIRMQVEIIAENFEPAVISAITGIQLNEQLIGILRSDLTRRYIIDVETDSTIRADLSQAQQNVSQFVQGFGGFIQSVGPAVQSGAMPIEVVVELLLSFARNYKLGRQAEAALESLKKPRTPQQDPQAQQQQIQQQQEASKNQQTMMMEKYKVDTDAKTKIQVANMDNQANIQIAAMREVNANQARTI